MGNRLGPQTKRRQAGVLVHKKNERHYALACPGTQRWASHDSLIDAREAP
jgi:hypothetical protein